MSDARIVKRTVIYTTPNDLRRIANLLQGKWNDSVLGDEVPKYILYGENCEVEFVIDQDEMQRKKQ